MKLIDITKENYVNDNESGSDSNTSEDLDDAILILVPEYIIGATIVKFATETSYNKYKLQMSEGTEYFKIFNTQEYKIETSDILK